VRAASRAAARGLAISSLSPDVASLEQVFADLTSSDEAPAEAHRA
jgi:hypothetical protein